MPTKKRGLHVKALARKRAELHIDGDIGRWDITARSLREQLENAGEISQLDVYLNSGGGSVIEGLNIYNMLKRHPAAVNIFIGGIAASMGSVIAMAGDRVVMPENALMMVHNPWGGAVGDADELRKIADILDKMKTSLVGIYAVKSGLERDAIWDMLSEETWLNGTEAQALGLVDEVEAPIEDEEELAAITAARDFQSAPLQDEVHQLVASVDKGWKPQLKETEGHFKVHLQGKRPAPDPAPTPLSPVITINQNGMDGSKIAGLIAEQLKGIVSDDGNTITVPQPSEQGAASDSQATEESTMTPEEMKAALKARNEQINQLFAKHTQLADLKMECLSDPDLTIEEAKDKLLAKLGEYHTPHGGIQQIESATTKAREGMAKALETRAGLGTKDDERNEFRGYTLLMMASKILELHGVTTHGDKMNLIGMAFTHGGSDFANLLSNVANKAMLKGFSEAPEVFDQFTGSGNLSDFKIAERVDIGHAPALREVRPGAEYKYITLGDKKEQAQLATYGELFGINRQTIINDDLDAFSRIPMKLGRAARRTVGDLVFNVITGATFDTSNSITGSPLSSANFDKLRVKMATQKDGDVTTPVRPSFLLTPIALQGTASQVMESEFMVDSAAKDSRQPNTVRNAATPIADYRLDANSATTYYGLGDPIQYDALDVLYLDGNSNPFLEQQNGWNIDGTEFKVRIDAAAKLWDKRSLGRGAA